MRRESWLLFLLVYLFPLQGEASTVSRVECVPTAPRAARCEIDLDGNVLPGERLVLSSVSDSDQLYFGDTRLGGTGLVFDQVFDAGFLPRIYSLQPLTGKPSPRLHLDVKGVFTSEAGIPRDAKVRVVDARYPLHKIFTPVAGKLVTFVLIVLLWFYLVLWLQEQTIDGWNYPRNELRWFLGAACTYLLLDHSIAKMFVPIAWSVELHIVAKRTALLVCEWALAGLLLEGRFSDRACVERGLSRADSRTLRTGIDLSLFAVLCVLAARPQLSTIAYYTLASGLGLVVLAAAVSAATGTEWRRVWKRSGSSPLFFHLTLLFLPLLFAAATLGRTLAWQGAESLIALGTWAALLAGALRLQRFQVTKKESAELTRECRGVLQRLARGDQRLHVFCEFFESEWGAARVSVISVEGTQGLVLASAGPDAISSENRAEPRKLGPFLRRVCKEGHLLYAPVAEELGKDLQERGMKHSSLAIPLLQEGKVRAVVCVMADEGERINPRDATQMEQVVDLLGLEILSAVAQHVAEEKNDRLTRIARNAGGFAIEHMDGWGHLHFEKNETQRFLVGAEANPDPALLGAIERSPTLSRLLRGYQLELRAIWTALAEAFEFLPKDVNADFWVLSPREYRQEFLQTLGPERSALSLAHLMERCARSLAAKPCYLPLGLPAARLFVGATKLRLVSYGGHGGGGVDTDAGDFALFGGIRNRAPAGSFLFWGEAPAGRLDDTRFTCKARPSPHFALPDLHSVLAVQAERRELRKIEARALEQARAFVRRAA